MQKEIIAAPMSGITPEQISILAQAGVIPDKTPPAILEVFAHACREHRLSPFKREVYLVRYDMRNGPPQYHTIVGIDGFRVKAARTGQAAGIDAARYNVLANGQFETHAMAKVSGKLPISCSVTVYRMISGQRCPFTATVLFDEYYPAVASAAKEGKPVFSKAATMPFNMISKCAEAKALKMAFSDELAGLHIEEEAAAMENKTIAAAEIKSALLDEKEIVKALANCAAVEEVAKLYFSDNRYGDFAQLFTDRKLEIDPELALSPDRRTKKQTAQ